MESEEKQAALSRAGGQFIVFRLYDELFGFNISLVNEITELLPLNPVPRAPEFVSGVINYHGRIVAVIDLTRFFNLEVDRAEALTRIIVFVPGEYQIGFLVDDIKEITHILEDSEEMNPMEGKNFKNIYIEGVACIDDELVNIINAGKLLADLEDYFKEVNIEY